MENLLKDVQFLKGVGPRRSMQLKRLGIETIFDLLWYVPRAYFNRSNPNRIASLKYGEQALIRGLVVGTHLSRSRQGLLIFKALIKDFSGMVTAVWFNQPYLVDLIKMGQEIFVSGRVKGIGNALELSVNEYEILDDSTQHIQIMPIYALTEGISQKVLRNIIISALNDYLVFYPDVIDEPIKKKYELCDIAYAFYNLHFPADGSAYLKARRRLALEELLLFQIKLRWSKREAEKKLSVAHEEKNDLVKRVIENLPFELTSAQIRVFNEISRDMSLPVQMNRLLQGDVGSGKTIIAALAAAKSIASGYQVAIMAPTEILAEQHYISISRFFKGQEVVISCLTGSTPAAERRLIIGALETGEIDIIIGTHALIQDDIKFLRLGLAVIDEQHRFGVKQRALLGLKGSVPDILVMTATPIPRTLALTVYGELSVSVLDELPPGRKEVKTRFVKNSAASQVYDFIKKQIINHDVQAYVVCPLVEESEKQDLIAAVSLYEELRGSVFTGFEVGLIHGRLKSSEKEQIMKRFKQGEIKVLISTTVIEVGVDVPTATIMVVVHAERFGLSQLHQLRGRVGRGKDQSYCFLIADPHTDNGYKRLKIMEKTSDGFKLAQYDLMLRGAGEFWGVKQHGLNQLKVADLGRDQKLIELSRQIAINNTWAENEVLTKYINCKYKNDDKIAGN